MTKTKLMLCAAVLAASACAPTISHTPATLQTTDGSQVVVVGETIRVSPKTGYARVVASGSEWREEGTIAQGTVYAPVGFVFTLESAHVREAYLVVKDGAVAGFYLPVERAFSPISTTTKITFQ